jgi:hypothetical protein
LKSKCWKRLCSKGKAPDLLTRQKASLDCEMGERQA